MKNRTSLEFSNFFHFIGIQIHCFHSAKGSELSSELSASHFNIVQIVIRIGGTQINSCINYFVKHEHFET